MALSVPASLGLFCPGVLKLHSQTSHQPYRSSPRSWRFNLRAWSLGPQPALHNRDDAAAQASARDLSRRELLSLFASVSGAGTAVAAVPYPAIAGPELKVQGARNMVAGRIPGLSDPDPEGFRTYMRPKGKSGGHGVGWTEFNPYLFKVPDGWEEVPVSIADLGGTEIDLRFRGAEGDVTLIVAPVLRFSSSLGPDPTIEQIGDPTKVITAFGPEITGETVDETKIVDMHVVQRAGTTYYNFELQNPHRLVVATAGSNRLYLFVVLASARQWKKGAETLRKMQESFEVFEA